MTVLTDRLLAASLETLVATAIVLLLSALALRRAPRLVALLWLVVLVKPLLTLAGVSLIPVRLATPSLRRETEVTARETRVAPAAGSRAPASEAITTHDSWEPVSGIWLAGVAFLLFRTLNNRLRLRKLVAGSRPATPRILSSFRRVLGSRRPPYLVVRMNDELDGPAIGGAFPPVILIPGWMDNRADDGQLDWALRHEMRHATAGDTLAIALRELALMVFWFHPLIWLAARRWEAAAELACDRDVVGTDTEAVDYAEALYRMLLNVRQHQQLQLTSGLFATRSKIGNRVAALVERPLAPKVGRPATTIAVAIAVVVIALGADLSAGNKHHHGDYEEVVDGYKITLHYDGEMELGDRVERLIGFIQMRETQNGVTRELRLDGDKDGIRRRYRIDGRDAPPDDAFERVVTTQLKRLMRPR
jgi:beta-lactamase regulating signal transducer with metallopeptidase domain